MTGKRRIEEALPADAVREAEAALRVLPKVATGKNEKESADAAIPLLAKHSRVFQRAGQLVHVVRAALPGKELVRPEGAPAIVAIPLAQMRELLSSVVLFTELRAKGCKVNGLWEPGQVEISVPQNIVNAITARGQWNDIRPLVGLASGPTLRPDGSVVAKPGYDAITGILSFHNVEFPTVPDAPTKKEVAAALAEVQPVARRARLLLQHRRRRR